MPPIARLKLSAVLIAVSFGLNAYASGPPPAVAELPALPPIGSVVGLPGSNAASVPTHPLLAPRSTAVYKLVMPDGSVTYSDRQIPGGKLEKKLSDGDKLTGMGTYSKPSTGPTSVPIVQDKITLPPANVRRDAELALAKAIEARRTASTVGENDRIATNNRDQRGKRYSRFSDSYLERQTEAEDAVTAAQKAVDQLPGR